MESTFKIKSAMLFFFFNFPQFVQQMDHPKCRYFYKLKY